MTDSKDMGIFGFGKDQDMRIFILIGVVLVVFAAAYLYYTNTGTDAEKALEEVGGFLGFMRRHLAAIIAYSILVILVILLIIFKIFHIWPFNTSSDAHNYWTTFTNKDATSDDVYNSQLAYNKVDRPSGDDLKAPASATGSVLTIEIGPDKAHTGSFDFLKAQDSSGKDVDPKALFNEISGPTQ